MNNKEVKSALSVTTFPSPIFRALKVNSDGYIEMFWGKYLNTRTQDLPLAYFDAGQFYWCKTKHFLKEKNLYSNKSKPVIIPRILAHDIDSVEDWTTAEKMFILLGLDKKNNHSV